MLYFNFPTLPLKIKVNRAGAFQPLDVKIPSFFPSFLPSFLPPSLPFLSTLPVKAKQMELPSTRKWVANRARQCYSAQKTATPPRCAASCRALMRAAVVTKHVPRYIRRAVQRYCCSAELSYSRWRDMRPSCTCKRRL